MVVAGHKHEQRAGPGIGCIQAQEPASGRPLPEEVFRTKFASQVHPVSFRDVDAEFRDKPWREKLESRAKAGIEGRQAGAAKTVPTSDRIEMIAAFNNLQFHPMMVHFPLALTLTGFLCLLFSRLLKHKPLHASLAACGTWNFIIAGITALMTLGTGLAAAWHLQLHGAMQHSVSRHVIWAVCTSQLVVFLGLWRAFANSADKTPTRLFLVLASIACAGFIVTGYYGGENVYHYAIGVRGP